MKWVVLALSVLMTFGLSLEMNLEYGSLSLEYPEGTAEVGYFGGTYNLGMGMMSFRGAIRSTLSGNLSRLEGILGAWGISVGYLYDSIFAVDSPMIGISGNVGMFDYDLYYVYPTAANVGFSYRLGKMLKIEGGVFAKYSKTFDYMGFAGVGLNFLGLEAVLKGFFGSSGLGGFSISFGYEDPFLYRALLSVEPEESLGKGVRTISSLTVEDLKKNPLSFYVYKYSIFGSKPAVGTVIEYSYQEEGEETENSTPLKTMVGNDGKAILAYNPQKGEGIISIKFHVPSKAFVDFASVPKDEIANNLIAKSKESNMVSRDGIKIALVVGAVPSRIVPDTGKGYTILESNAVVLENVQNSFSVRMKIIGFVGDVQKEVKAAGTIKVRGIYVFNLKGLTFRKPKGVLVEAGTLAEGKFDLTIKNLKLSTGDIAFVVMDYYNAVGGKSVKAFSDFMILSKSPNTVRTYMRYLNGRLRGSNVEYATLVVSPNVVVGDQPIDQYGEAQINVILGRNVVLRKLEEGQVKGAVRGKRFKLPYGLYRLRIMYSGIEDVEMLLRVDKGVDLVQITLTNSGDFSGMPLEENDNILWSSNKLFGAVTEREYRLTAIVDLKIKRLYLLSKLSGTVRLDGEYGFKDAGNGLYEIVKGYENYSLRVSANSGVAFKFVSILEKNTSLIFKPSGTKAAFRLALGGRYPTNYTYYFIEDYYKIDREPDVSVVLKIPIKYIKDYNMMRIYGVIGHKGYEYFVPIETTLNGAFRISVGGETYRINLPIAESVTESKAYSYLFRFYGDIPVTYYIVFYKVGVDSDVVTAESDPIRLNFQSVLKNGYFVRQGNIYYVDIEKATGGFKKEEF